jgi:hypothetical protein
MTHESNESSYRTPQEHDFILDVENYVAAQPPQATIDEINSFKSHPFVLRGMWKKVFRSIGNGFIKCGNAMAPSPPPPGMYPIIKQQNDITRQIWADPDPTLDGPEATPNPIDPDQPSPE